MGTATVNQRTPELSTEFSSRTTVAAMGRKKQRRQSHGSAWHWKQTDTWYYTLPGTKRRVALFGEDGQRIKGKANKKAADLALSRVKLQGWDQSPPTTSPEEYLVAQVCSEYLQY